MSNDDFENDAVEDNAFQPIKNIQPKNKSNREHKELSIVFLSLGIKDSIISIILTLCFIVMGWVTVITESQTIAFLLIFATCGLGIAFLLAVPALIKGIVFFVGKIKGKKFDGALPVLSFVLGIVAFLLNLGVWLVLIILNS